MLKHNFLWWGALIALAPGCTSVDYVGRIPDKNARVSVWPGNMMTPAQFIKMPVSAEDKLKIILNEDSTMDPNYRTIEPMLQRGLLQQGFKRIKVRTDLLRIVAEGLANGKSAEQLLIDIMDTDYQLTVTVNEIDRSDTPLCAGGAGPRLVLGAKVVRIDPKELGLLQGAGDAKGSIKGLQLFHNVMCVPTVWIWRITFQPLINGLFAPSRDDLFNDTVQGLCGQI